MANCTGVLHRPQLRRRGDPRWRNVFDATLDLMAPTFLTSPRNIAPVVSRMRFEAIDNLRIQWDLDYDSIAGRIAANNLFAGYSFGRTTLGIGHALLNAVDEKPALPTALPTVIKSQQLQPFLEIGKQSGKGFNLALNGGYDFVHTTCNTAACRRSTTGIVADLRPVTGALSWALWVRLAATKHNGFTALPWPTLAAWETSGVLTRVFRDPRCRRCTKNSSISG